MLSMVQQAFFGPLKEPVHPASGLHGVAVSQPHVVGDMNFREMLSIVPICALCLWIGVAPQPLINIIKPDVDAVAAIYETGDEAPTQARIGGETATLALLSRAPHSPPPAP
jgi:NADH-quinone oxidoreductase subunit M